MAEVNKITLLNTSSPSSSSGAEEQAAKDAAALEQLIEQLAAVSQDYLTTKNPADLAKMQTILNTEMSPYMADLKKLAPQLPQGEVDSLENLLPLLADPTSPSFATNLLQFSLPLGIIRTQELGPISPTSADTQAETDVTAIYNLLFPGSGKSTLSTEVEEYLSATGPEKEIYLKQIEGTLSQMKGVLGELQNLPVSPQLQGVINALESSFPTASPEDPAFLTQLAAFTHLMGGFYGFFQS